MKPPNISSLPTDTQQKPSQQASNSQNTSQTVVPMDVSTTATPAATNPIPPSQQPAVNKAPTIATTMVTSQNVQQAPLALTTVPQAPTVKPQTIQQSSVPQTSTTTQSQSLTSQTVTQQQTGAKLQSTPMLATTTPITTQSATSQQPIALATAPTTTGPTALVIIPQHSTTTSANHIKAVTKVAAPIATTTTVGGVAATHLTLAATTQSAPMQLQTPITTHVSSITPIALTPAHQQSTTIAVQSSLANRPPTLPVVPAQVTVKSEPVPNKYTCCLLDNGTRCERAAGNASFSARIQKIVGTKKMNYTLDPTVRHAYICEHHKAIITVAKKTQTARDSKANARNYTANNTLANQPIGNFNDLSRQQQAMTHPVNLEMLNNQNRLTNNHTGPMNSIPVRPGVQIAYSHYQGAHPNQVGPMDMMMSNAYDNTSGDALPPSSSGGVDVDLQQLQVNTLRRYKRHFRVPTKPGLNKMQLAESLKSHFRTLPIIEKEAITYFVYIVKCYRNKLDHNPKAD